MASRYDNYWDPFPHIVYLHWTSHLFHFHLPLEKKEHKEHTRPLDSIPPICTNEE